jgi:arsenate reductase (glutaredoxin)
LLADHGFEATYREYTKQPLSRAELVDLLKTLRMAPRDVLRAADAAKAALSATASDDEVLDAMVANNRLLQRPILVTPKGARVGRPVENLLEVM